MDFLSGLPIGQIQAGFFVVQSAINLVIVLLHRHFRSGKWVEDFLYPLVFHVNQNVRNVIVRGASQFIGIVVPIEIATHIFGCELSVNIRRCRVRVISDIKSSFVIKSNGPYDFVPLHGFAVFRTPWQQESLCPDSVMQFAGMQRKSFKERRMRGQAK